MKKITAILIIIGIFFLSISTEPIKAETLGDIKAKLRQQEEDLKNNQNEQNKTAEEIASTNAAITKTKAELQGIYVDIQNAEESITKLNQQIIQKEKEMKDIVNFVQISNGESAYLEYAFGAQDFTDFIYRMAVSEQLTKYNDKLIKDYNQMIEDNKQKKKDLEKKNQELSAKQDLLANQMKSLQLELNHSKDIQMTIESEIKYQKELVQLYTDKGCGDNEDIRTCGKSYLPKDTSFWRPLKSGRVTSEYGMRDYITGILGSSDHSGLDMSAGGATNIPVYSAANGMVSGVFYKQKCGGNEVIIHHNINGTTYTTMFAHLLTINVSVGQMVTKDTVIGLQGGGPETWGWDTCSTGAHVHFTVAKGLYGKGLDYESWNAFMARTFNPRSVVNVPLSHSVWWSDRLTKY